MFSGEKLSQKKNIGKKSFYSNTSYGFEYEKPVHNVKMLKCS